MGRETGENSQSRWAAEEESLVVGGGGGEEQQYCASLNNMSSIACKYALSDFKPRCRYSIQPVFSWSAEAESS